MTPSPNIPDLTGLVRCDFQNIGQGAVSDVYKGDLSSCAVAIKVFRIKDGEKCKRRFDREGRTWMTLQSNPHENIVEFLGTMNWNGNQLALVSLYVDDGTVVQYVKKNAGANRGRLVLDIAKGLKHMHDLKIVHGDLKAVNVLVNGAGVAQITDFGHSRLLEDETYATQTRHRGAVVYLAPETLIKMAASEKIDVSTLATKEADIYAFSVTASEVLKGEEYHLRGSMGAIHPRVVDKRIRPSGDGIPNAWYTILIQCWEADPSARPGIGQVVNDLTNLFSCRDCIYGHQNFP